MTAQNTKTMMKQWILCLILGLGISVSALGQQEGLGTYYADKYHGRSTASGELYNKFKYTAAHRTLPFGTVVMVTNLSNNRSVRVKINDRGPFSSGRIIDLSRAAAEQIDMIRMGEVKVRVQVVSGRVYESEPLVSRDGFSPVASPRSRVSNVDLSKLPVVDINGNPISPTAEQTYRYDPYEQPEQRDDSDRDYYGLKPENQEVVSYTPGRQEPVAYVPGRVVAPRETDEAYEPTQRVASSSSAAATTSAPIARGLFRMTAYAQEAVGYGVQVGAYFDYKRLMAGLDEMARKGLQNTMVHHGVKNGKPVYRILIGPYGSKAQADQMLRNLKSSKLSGLTVDLSSLR